MKIKWRQRTEFLGLGEGEGHYYRGLQREEWAYDQSPSSRCLPCPGVIPSLLFSIIISTEASIRHGRPLSHRTLTLNALPLSSMYVPTSEISIVAQCWWMIWGRTLFVDLGLRYWVNYEGYSHHALLVIYSLTVTISGWLQHMDLDSKIKCVLCH